METTTEQAALMSELFEKFWNIYPRRIAKGAALKAFKKLDPSEELVAEMLRAIGAQSRYRREMDSAKQFIPPWKHPATWLNGECWEDELGSVSTLREKIAPGLCECGKEEFMKAGRSPNGKPICPTCYALLTWRPKALTDGEKRELWEKLKRINPGLATVVRSLRDSFNRQKGSVDLATATRTKASKDAA